MRKKIITLSYLILSFSALVAQTPLPIRQLLQADYMQGASFSLKAVEVKTGTTLYQYEEERELIPASVMKLVTTATALELLGEEYRFPTSLSYDGELRDGILHGNLYIEGSGDPTLGSTHFSSDRTRFTADQLAFLSPWVEAIRQAGIREIRGAVVADESYFDLEGISPRWLWEDLGNYYGAGSYGLNVFDNLFYLTLSTGNVGSRATVLSEEPVMHLHYRNALTAAAITTDSAFIQGAPFSQERSLTGLLPANRSRYVLKGDIPDPPHFLAQLFADRLRGEGITISEAASSWRLLTQSGRWNGQKRTPLTTTYSPMLREIIRVINHRSHNLYADACLKAVGVSDSSHQPRSSFEKGIHRTQQFLREKGIDDHALWMHDGSGLSPFDKLSATFLTDLLCYMATQSPVSDTYIHSLPTAGREGSVANFLRGTPLENKTRLKSGSMSRVKAYAGYIQKDGKQYAIALFVNNYSCEGRDMTRALEKMLVGLFAF
ncbi:D-alanyl-D-alanine carboxypeptidase/D-alanyl-D-alanine-endopeptidase (penicillin-binding protein 4) [Parabacteroides sp. PFB2-12]|uniref:D-alanyl-D-alanine carboxypeptidase/D-alanyl-D-alanine endopeptidase n=1 Tax=unclassified Parabacteroides TaxID=2649774 RepID=UPI002472FA58|nr:MULTISPECIES: D-alanyl-D-alanine carboxypeptidase/D-alanyl-D-alanine-endopeptidase [unclassified Parabacteroides]MDH6343877.1 D-alanyl-D-alanine carboxypeptidase/D-alanyl-D-alanine-endopeptidase (penicillin-binding protein 4) [Parabacteroides sp. PM6-13]MDH6391239.1 D-alanyl-D-alanine carboxypeptidase/D-alanyl-D-alanine-endopeptidase (penicillin-binding protein 4) [Parabacteroides sp. PFB2-12]